MKCNTCECPLPASGSICPCGKVSYCSTECQKQNWKVHKPACPPYKVIKIEGKGKGLVTTRKVAAGDVLLQEMPLMVIDSIDSEVSSDHFKLEFEVLGEATQKKVLELFDPVKDDLKLELLENINEVEAGIRKGREEDPDNQELGELVQRMGELGAGIISEADEEEEDYIRAQRIFAANSMQVCEVGAIYSSTEGALYHHISLINHSCNPNAVWSWTNGNFRKKVVRAIKPIKKGEEILVNYIDLEDFNYGNRESRRLALVDKFGFFCKCSECSLEGDEFDLNEQHRLEVVQNLETVKTLMAKHNERSTVQALNTGSSTVVLVKELGLMLELPRILLNMYQVATAARYQNIIGSVNPAVFRDRALALCSLFGDSFLYFYNFVCRPD